MLFSVVASLDRAWDAKGTVKDLGGGWDYISLT